MYFDNYFISKPAIAVEGGIKAQLKKGGASDTWWGQKWVDALEDYGDYGRMSRGRSYARKGQVIDIKIAPGLITAKVQGSDVRPYKIKIKIETIKPEKWKKLAKKLSGKIYYAAKLMAGYIPADIEEEFESLGLYLLPDSKRRLETTCSCPDWGDPCKHIAAVHYITGIEIDRDPFLLFKIKGIEQDDFMDMLVEAGDGIVPMRTTGKIDDINIDINEPEETKEPPQPLCAIPSLFWGENISFSPMRIEDIESAGFSSSPIPKLGNIPFWQGNEPFELFFDRVYSTAAEKTIAAFTKNLPD
ncbi:MAG: SWIM zinc finger family protein [Firmicutes bacterium]|nr:SWIM zinc finger family protein [Bacillota bacterium]